MSLPVRYVFVTVGTDHHPFDRLIGWIDTWQTPPGVEVRVMVQHGSSRPPCRHESVAFLNSVELAGHMERADVVVTQGGPGGIMDALRAGRRPVVVARRADLQEVVDDHQAAFVAHLAALGDVEAVTTGAQLHRRLTEGVLVPATYRRPPMGPTPPRTVAAVAEVVEEAIVDAGRPGWRGRLPHRPRQSQLRSRSISS